MILLGLILERFRVKSLGCVKEPIMPFGVSSKRCTRVANMNVVRDPLLV